jgi:hypothetical protein
MKAVKRDLQSVIKSLKSLTEKAEKISGQLDALTEDQSAQKKSTKAAESKDKAKGPKGAKTAKTAKRAKAGPTATDTVLNIIRRQKKGIDTAGLKKKTDFDTKTIRNVIFRLKKQGKVETTSRGIYMAV